jgi:hypothetical protein
MVKLPVIEQSMPIRTVGVGNAVGVCVGDDGTAGIA